MQTRSGSAVHVSNKNKYEQLENDQKCITGIMSGKFPQLSSRQQDGWLEPAGDIWQGEKFSITDDF